MRIREHTIRVKGNKIQNEQGHNDPSSSSPG